MHHALNPDQYRGVFGSDGEKYAKDVQEIIDFGTTGRIAGFISEAIQVCSYSIIPDSYITFKNVEKHEINFSSFNRELVELWSWHLVIYQQCTK